MGFCTSVTQNFVGGNMKVKRYSPIMTCKIAEMIETPVGRWVSYPDYSRLQDLLRCLRWDYVDTPATLTRIDSLLEDI